MAASGRSGAPGGRGRWADGAPSRGGATSRRSGWRRRATVMRWSRRIWCGRGLGAVVRTAQVPAMRAACGGMPMTCSSWIVRCGRSTARRSEARCATVIRPCEPAPWARTPSSSPRVPTSRRGEVGTRLRERLPSRRAPAGCRRGAVRCRRGVVGAFWSDVPVILRVAFPAIMANLATPLGNAYVTGAMAKFGNGAVAGWTIAVRLSFQ